MKRFFITLSVSLLCLSAHAAKNKNFFECGPFAGVDEYRVGIDTKAGIAGFFDNDTTSMMKLTKTEFLESNPPQFKMTFMGKESSFAGMGKESSFAGYLKLYFNLTRKEATLLSISKSGKAELIGKANCENAAPWDFNN